MAAAKAARTRKRNQLETAKAKAPRRPRKPRRNPVMDRLIELGGAGVGAASAVYIGAWIQKSAAEKDPEAFLAKYPEAVVGGLGLVLGIFGERFVKGSGGRAGLTGLGVGLFAVALASWVEKMRLEREKEKENAAGNQGMGRNRDARLSGRQMQRLRTMRQRAERMRQTNMLPERQETTGLGEMRSAPGVRTPLESELAPRRAAPGRM